MIIVDRQIKNIFTALGLHTTDIFIINYASVTVMLLLLCLRIVVHALETVPCVKPFIAFHFPCSLPLRHCDSIPSVVPILPICSVTYPLLLFFLVKMHRSIGRGMEVGGPRLNRLISLIYIFDSLPVKYTHVPHDGSGFANRCRDTVTRTQHVVGMEVK